MIPNTLLWDVVFVESATLVVASPQRGMFAPQYSKEFDRSHFSIIFIGQKLCNIIYSFEVATNFIVTISKIWIRNCVYID